MQYVLKMGVVVVAMFAAVAQAERAHIQIVGSSTVYPFATVVAEKFGKTSEFKTPIIEATGSGGGLKLFCGGVGETYPDIANASRRIKPSEFEQCQANGVAELVEIKIGYDGIILGHTIEAMPMTVSRRDLFLALARMIPNPAGGETLVANPHTTWQEINADLPAKKIEVLGPPPTSGTRDAFTELAMEGGCQSFAWLVALKETDQAAYQATCHTVREDGAYIEVGENDNLIVQKLRENQHAFGLFGFSFLDQNSDIIQGARIDGVAAEFEAIADGSYPVSRPLYFYMKKAHVGIIPGLHEYLMAFASEAAWGEEGYLSDKGLIPMPAAERAQFAAAAAQLIPLTPLDW